MSKLNKLYFGSVNPPIYQASTILFENISELESSERQYGRVGTETNAALEREIARIENAERSVIVESGLAAITNVLLSFLQKGDHILLCKTAYQPTRDFCEKMLNKFGVDYDYFSGDANGDEIKKLAKNETKLILLESPASIIFEIQELDEIINFAKEKNILTVIDNTWSGGVLFKPHNLGIDVSIQSLSKYAGGHSDLILGAISFRKLEIFKRFWPEFYQLGSHASPQDCYLALRGLNTMELRMKKHQENALKIADYLASNAKVKEVIYPLSPNFKQKERFLKYFSGANGLLTISLNDSISEKETKQFIDNLNHIRLGYSWGGFESLVMFYKNYIPEAPLLLRFHIGIEDASLIIADLEQAFDKIK